MFDKLIDIILEFIGLFQFWTVVDTYEKSVVLRLGKYNRTLDTGFHFIIPFYIEVVLVDNTVPSLMDLGSQTLQTEDDINIVVTTNVLWEIVDIKKFLLDIEDAESIIEGVVYGQIADYITSTKYEDIMAESPMLLKESRIKCKVYGVMIKLITFRDFAEIKTLRIIGDSVVIPDD